MLEVGPHGLALSHQSAPPMNSDPETSAEVFEGPGAAGAAGHGLAAAFAGTGAGADVVGVVRSAPQNPLAGFRYEIANPSDDASVADLFNRVGAPWAVVNTVGGFAPHRRLTDLDELSQQLTLNLATAAILTKHALRSVKPGGEGRIIHTASRAATVTAGSGFSYSVSKAGVLHLVKMAAQETATTRIRVNAVSPSIIDTAANRAAMPDADHGSWPTVDDIAVAYLFLASTEAGAVNGAGLPV